MKKYLETILIVFGVSLLFVALGIAAIVAIRIA